MIIIYKVLFHCIMPTEHHYISNAKHGNLIISSGTMISMIKCYPYSSPAPQQPRDAAAQCPCSWHQSHSSFPSMPPSVSQSHHPFQHCNSQVPEFFTSARMLQPSQLLMLSRLNSSHHLGMNALASSLS